MRRQETSRRFRVLAGSWSARPALLTVDAQRYDELALVRDEYLGLRFIRRCP